MHPSSCIVLLLLANSASSSPAPVVELVRLLPRVPPVPPGTSATPIHTGAALRSPVHLPELDAIAALDGNDVVLFGERGLSASTLARGACAFTPLKAFGDTMLAVATQSGALQAVSASENSGDLTVTAVAVPLAGAEALTVTAFASLSDGRLLAGVAVNEDSSTLMCLSADSPPQALLTGLPGMVSACVSSDDRSLLLVTGGGAVWRCGLSFDEDGVLSCALPDELSELLPADTLATAVVVDVNDNVYACTEQGVWIGDETGEAFAHFPTPLAATGCCFGGTSLSELCVTTGDTVWMLRTGTSGVAPPSAKFLKRMELLASNDGDRRHIGW